MSVSHNDELAHKTLMLNLWYLTRPDVEVDLEAAIVACNSRSDKNSAFGRLCEILDYQSIASPLLVAEFIERHSDLNKHWEKLTCIKQLVTEKPSVLRVFSTRFLEDFKIDVTLLKRIAAWDSKLLECLVDAKPQHILALTKEQRTDELKYRALKCDASLLPYLATSDAVIVRLVDSPEFRVGAVSRGLQLDVKFCTEALKHPAKPGELLQVLSLFTWDELATRKLLNSDVTKECYIDSLRKATGNHWSTCKDLVYDTLLNATVPAQSPELLYPFLTAFRSAVVEDPSLAKDAVPKLLAVLSTVREGSPELVSVTKEVKLAIERGWVGRDQLLQSIACSDRVLPLIVNWDMELVKRSIQYQGFSKVVDKIPNELWDRAKVSEYEFLRYIVLDIEGVSLKPKCNLGRDI